MHYLHENGERSTEPLTCFGADEIMIIFNLWQKYQKNFAAEIIGYVP
jgi:hypothetical protein